MCPTYKFRRRCAPPVSHRAPSGAHRLSYFGNNFTCYRHVKLKQEGFAERGPGQQDVNGSGRIQTLWSAPGVVYMGPSSPIPPGLLEEIEVLLFA